MTGGLIGLVVSSTVALTSTAARELEARGALEDRLGPVPFSVTADKLIAEVESGVYVAEGDVLFVRGPLVLRADRVQFDRVRDLAIADGNVTVIDEKSVLFCSHVEVKMPDLIGGLRDAELRIKSGIPVGLRAQLAGDALREYGRDELIVGADELVRTSARSFEVQGGTITTCDCTEGQAPTWSISASSASVDLDSGATMWLPVFYAKGIPVFVLPAFYLPLGSRRTGLLLPRFQTSAVTAFSIYEPFFLTLGDSYDLTLEPGFLWSRGPSGAAEFRWAPTPATRGELRGTLTLDYGFKLDDGTYERTNEDAIARYAISGDHETRWKNGAFVADINFLGDPNYSEFSDRYLTRLAEYSHSRITVTTTADNGVRTSGGLGLMEDLRGATYAPDDKRIVEILSDDLITGAGEVRYRIAELRLDAPLTPVMSATSPLLGDARLALHAFTAPHPIVPRFVRADLRPRVIAPLKLGGVAVIEPAVALRLSGWAARAVGESSSATRAAAIGGVRLSTELWRSFGDVVHSIRPELAYLMVPYTETAGTVYEAFDEIDRLAPVQQFAARIATDFHDAKNGRRIGGLDVRAGRDLDFRGRPGAGWSEVVARGDLQLAPSSIPLRVYADASVALDPHRDGKPSEVLAGVTMTTSRGDLLSVRYGDFAKELPEYSLAAFEELVHSNATELEIIPSEKFRGVSVAARTGIDLWEGWGRLSLGFDAGFVFGEDPATLVGTFGPDSVRYTLTTIGWASSCKCFAIEARIMTDRTRPGFELAGFGIDLGGLGGVRTD